MLYVSVSARSDERYEVGPFPLIERSSPSLSRWLRGATAVSLGGTRNRFADRLDDDSGATAARALGELVHR